VKRREFIAFVVGAATPRPFVARPAGRQVADDRVPQHQQPSAIGSWLAALEQRLRELGWIKGRWAEGLPERSPGFVEFVRLKVDVIVTTVTAVAALK
jgi:hypothetical protein